MRNILVYITVEPVLFLYMMLIFLETSALQGLMFFKVCSNFHPNDTNVCLRKNESGQEEVIHETAMWTKYCGSCLFLCTLIVSFYVGSWSDYFGRKVTMLIPPIGSLIAAGINTILSVFITVHIAYFFISAAVSGFTFGILGVITGTFGYISDITPEETRTKRIVILEAMIFTGGTFGSAIAAYMLANKDVHVLFNNFARAFVLEMAVAVLIIFYVTFRIPSRTHANTADKNDTQAKSCFQIFSWSHVRNAFSTVFRARDGRKRQRILLLLVAIIMIYYGSAVQFSLAFLFVKGKPLVWNITEYSTYNAVQFAFEGAALLFGLPILLHCYKVPDAVVAILGTVSRMAGLVLFGLSDNVYMVYSCALVYMLSEFSVPAVRSMLSKIVDKDEKGKIFAFTTILQNACYLTASLILNSIFGASSSFFPGLVFQIVAFLQAIALAIFCYLHFTTEQAVSLYEVLDGDT